MDSYKNEKDPHNVGLQSEGEEVHQEKQSVFGKVKAKARKIKDTLITKHGPAGHNRDNHDGDHVPDDHDLDEKEDEDGVTVRHPDVDPPKHGSVPGQVESFVHPGVPFERTTAPTPTAAMPISTGNYQTKVSDPPKIDVPGQEGNKGQPGVNFGKTKVMGEGPHAPKDKPDAYTPSNYQTKVPDPTGTGGQEAGITPILHSLDKMNIHDEPETKAKTGPKQSLPTETHNQMFDLTTGSHDQFSPEPMRPKPITTQENPNLDPETFDPTKYQDQPRDNTADKPSNQSSYSEKISSATPKIAGLAISGKNVVASKLGYGEKDNKTADESREGGENAKSASPVEYTKYQDQPRDNTADKPSNQSSYSEKISSATPKIAGLAISGKNVVASKLGYGEKDNKTADESREGGENAKSASPVEYTKYQDQPRDNTADKPSNQSSYSEKISSATPKIAGLAISGKNVVASKLGYGEKDNKTADESREGGENATSASPVEYGKKINDTKYQDQPRDTTADKPSNQSSYSEKISSVTPEIADKAISGKNVVASKLGYGEKDNMTADESREGGENAKSASPVEYTKYQDQPRDNTADKPSNQSSYFEQISSATSSVKNVVASKLGYGEKDNTTADESREGGENAKSASPVEYTKYQDQPRDNTADKPSNQSSYSEKISSAKNVVASKLGYGEKDMTADESRERGENAKSASPSAGSTVMSKMYGTSTGTGSEQEGGVERQDKGMPVKNYFAEKLRPGEEDRALSEVISETLHKKKEEPEKSTSSRPMGKVTESEEVARGLSSEDENSGERVDSSFVNTPEKGVVDKLKGAVSSWFGKGEESEAAAPHGNEGLSSSPTGKAGPNSGIEGEQRPQESGN